VVLAGLVHASGAAAQTTTTPAPTTTPTTQPATTSTAAPTTSPATTTPAGTTSPPPVTEAPSTTADDSGDDFPWWAVALGGVALIAIIVGVAAISRRGAARRSAVDTWRRRATDEIGEVGATARLLAGGTPVSAAIAQQVLSSLRTLDDLAQSAPDDRTRRATHDARQAVRALGIAIDAEVSARRAQPPVEPDQLDAAAAGLRAAASDADGALRTAYHEIGEPR
jgi:hypothetical protein